MSHQDRLEKALNVFFCVKCKKQITGNLMYDHFITGTYLCEKCHWHGMEWHIGDNEAMADYEPGNR